MISKDLKYTRLSRDDYGVHKKIINLVSPKSNVLEIGCASGYMSKELVKKGCNVWGIEVNEKSAREAKKYCNKVITGDIENKKTLARLNKMKFEVILLADVMEHLRNPEEVLTELVSYLSHDGEVILSVPNIAFLTNRLNHLLGKFDYENYGIMDSTHLRFFTRKTLISLIQRSKLRVKSFDVVGNFTQLPLFMQTLHKLVLKKKWWKRMEYKLTKLWPEGLAVQFLVVCRKDEKT